MKTFNSKASNQLTAVFGRLQMGDMPEFPKDSVTLDAGWIELILGRDVEQKEFVMASTRLDGFLLTARPSEGRSIGIPRKCRQWVYSLKTEPVELLLHGTQQTEVVWGDFRIVHGVDRERRKYLYVVMPGGRGILLFRDPKSRSVRPWSPAGSIEVRNGMVAMPVSHTRTLMDSTPGCTETDARELDELLVAVAAVIPEWEANFASWRVALAKSAAALDNLEKKFATREPFRHSLC